jgi:hypothetical protein
MRCRETRKDSDLPPYDMRLAGHAFRAVAERRSPVVIPSHFEHVRIANYLFNAQFRPKRALMFHQVRFEGF